MTVVFSFVSYLPVSSPQTAEVAESNASCASPSSAHTPMVTQGGRKVKSIGRKALPTLQIPEPCDLSRKVLTLGAGGHQPALDFVTQVLCNIGMVAARIIAPARGRLNCNWRIQT
jgi:hypothetical protein